MKLSRAQISVSYYGACGAKWIAKYGANNAARMIREAIEYSEVLGQSSFAKIWEIATGARVG